MTYLTKPKLHHPDLPKNSLGLTRRDYEGAISTLEQQLSLTADQGVRRSDRSYRGAEEILGNVRDDTSWGPDCCKRSNLLERNGMNARIKSGHDVKTCLLSER